MPPQIGPELEQSDLRSVIGVLRSGKSGYLSNPDREVELLC